MSASLASRKQRHTGQALVEFALVLIPFLLMFFAVIDGGRLVYMNTVLSQAAREGARVGAVEASHIGTSGTDPSCNKFGGPVCPASLATFEADVLAAANREVAPYGAITSAQLFMSCTAPSATPANPNNQGCSSNAAGNVITVKVQLSFTAITPIAGPLLPAVTLTGSATMVIN